MSLFKQLIVENFEQVYNCNNANLAYKTFFDIFWNYFNSSFEAQLHENK